MAGLDGMLWVVAEKETSGQLYWRRVYADEEPAEQEGEA